MSKRCVVSFADTPFYRSKMERLKASINTPGVDVVTFTDIKQIHSDYYEQDCKPHSVVPYQFKPFAIQKVKEMGYSSVLWLDSPIIQVKDLSPVFEHIEKFGYVFFDNIGHSLGRWTNDKTLDFFGLTREKANGIKMIMACAMGFHFAPPYIPDFLFGLYLTLSDSLYPGSWDKHRHDQSVMSCILNQYNHEILNGQQTFFMYEDHRFAVPINEETICLISK